MDVFHAAGSELLVQAILSLKNEDECRAFLEDLMTGKEIQIVHPKGDQSWVFIERTDVEAETPILWPPDENN